MATIQVEHIRLTSPRGVDEVVAALEASVPHLDERLPQMLTDEDKDAIAKERRSGAPLWIFERRDHGGLLAAEGRPRKAWQYEIGNPVTAESMTRHHLAAGLYAPLRVMIYEDEQGGTVIEYDRPSDLFGQFGNPAIAETGRMLDAEIAEALARAMDQQG